MATNLRLRPEAQAALRAESRRTGRPQQDLIREAVDVALGLAAPRSTSDPPDARRAAQLAARGVVVARAPFAELADLVRLPVGLTAADLVDRTDRS